MNLLITLCARGGSKGIPGKNIRPINNKPLIAYSIETALHFSKQQPALIALSTDDITIKEVASSFGLHSDYIRPAQYATDNAGKTDAIYDLILFEEKRAQCEFDYILDLDITSPLRTVKDLEIAFETFQKDGEAMNLFSVNKAGRNPYFNMVEQQPDGYYGLVKKGNFLTRQSAPPVYDLNASFYFYRRQFFDTENRSTINNKSLIYIMPHLCFDLDEPVDFDFMSYLMENNRLGFQLL